MNLTLLRRMWGFFISFFSILIWYKKKRKLLSFFDANTRFLNLVWLISFLLTLIRRRVFPVMEVTTSLDSCIISLKWVLCLFIYLFIQDSDFAHNESWLAIMCLPYCKFDRPSLHSAYTLVLFRISRLHRS